MRIMKSNKNVQRIRVDITTNVVDFDSFYFVIRINIY